jgi:hypothetical protein
MGFRSIPGRLVTRVTRAVHDRLPDIVAVQWRYRRVKGRWLNLRRPRTFDEKLHWLNLSCPDLRRDQLADKYTVRDYVSRRLGPHVLNELYGVWDRVADLPFDSLPKAFVLKVTAGCGWNIIVPDKSRLDCREAREKLSQWMATDYYLRYRERPYKNARKRIICERYLGDATGEPPPDFKFLCFNGRPRYVQVDTDRYTRHARLMFEPDWRPAPFSFGRYPPCREPIPKPDNLDEMLEMAAKLSQGFPFMRTDFYSIAGRVIFGEVTLFPSAGFNYFNPKAYQLELGRMLDLWATPSQSAEPVQPEPAAPRAA